MAPIILGLVSTIIPVSNRPEMARVAIHSVLAALGDAGPVNRVPWGDAACA
ncbi:MAG: hypothetical protein WAT36_09935 [Chromatiaceae bacterium]